MVKNGKIHNGKQNYKHKDCGHQFLRDPQHKIISDVGNKRAIDKLPLERLPLAKITRLAEFSAVWLQQPVNLKYQ
ncbi:MAG: hypothetical protein AAF609_20270 [Cyanobacteria bacterium P01_C01_bin.120]